MIPVLYAESETEFSTNGEGRLGEATECIVEEERNGKYELELQYPVEGERFSDLKHSKIIFAAPSDGAQEQPFRIYSISKPIGGIVTVKAEHISYQLSHIPVSPFTATACAEALLGLKNNAAEACPFTFWTDKTTAANFAVTEPASLRSRLGGVQGSILDAYGGEYEFDRYTVKLHSARGSDRGVTLRYGKNITDIRQEENIQNTITGVYPFWKGAEGDTETLVVLPEKILRVSNAGNYPYKRTVPLDLSQEFQEQPTETQLRQRANAYMADNGIGVPSISIKVSFIPLWQTEEYKDAANLERVRLCDIVSVEFPKLGISTSSKVVRTKYDVLKERYVEIELGDARTSLASSLQGSIDAARGDALKAIRETSSALKKETARNTARITGADGGSIQHLFDANGNPMAIMALNTDDAETATECLLLNYAGLGGSQNGIAGPFITAITSDGHINADMITTGHLLATLIRGGVLALGGTDTSGSFGNGVLKVYDASDAEIGTWGVNGIVVKKGTIQGPAIIAGGNRNADGTITVKDASGNTIGTWDKDGINVAEGTIDGPTINIGGSDNKRGVLTIYDKSGNVAVKVSNVGIAMKSTATDETRIIPAVDGSYSYCRITNSSNGAAHPAHLNVGNYYGGKVTIGAYERGSDYYSEISDNGATLRGLTKTGCLRVGSDKWSNSHSEGFIYCTMLDTRSTDGTGLVRTDALYVNGSQISASSSSCRYKHDIRSIRAEELDPHLLLKLPVVEFVFNDGHPLQYADMAGKTIPGLIAEDVAQIYPAAAITRVNEETGGTEIESWDERRILPGMLALIQEQQEKLEAQGAQIEELRRKMEKLEQMMQELAGKG